MGEHHEQRGGMRPENVPDAPGATPETVELIYEHTKSGAADQLHDSAQLDTKAAAVFAAGTVAIGLASRLPQFDDPSLHLVLGITTNNPQVVDVSAVDACIYLAVVFWASSVVVTLLNLNTRSYWRPLQADDLWPDYAEREPEQLKRILVRDAARCYAHNREPLKWKARLFNVAVVATGIEGFFIVVALVLTR